MRLGKGLGGGLGVNELLGTPDPLAIWGGAAQLLPAMLRTGG